ncbi:MAG: DUF4340 domain-containing protein [Nitrospiraceae bacterium]|nr:MAG: DUF4340 domain-containing protein [Nitrospiraceae bacterium]
MVEEKKILRFKGTLILLGISLLVASLYIFYLLPRAREQKLIEELSSRFFRVDVSEVEFLRIQNQNGGFNMIKNGDQWKLTTPIFLPTDSKALQRLFEIITKGKIVKVITNDMSRAAEFKLDHPVAAFFIGYKGRIDELAIGGSNPAGTGVYAFAKGIKAIFVVEKEIAEIATVGLYDLRSKSLFSFNPESVTGMHIIKKDGDIVLTKEAGAWEMVRPVPGKASVQDISDFLLNVMNQRADDFYDNSVPDSKDYSGTVTLQLYAGRQVSADIDVHYWGTDVNQGAVAYQKGMKYAGRLSRDFWNLVSRDASVYRYRDLFAFDENQVGSLAVQKGTKSYKLVRKGEDWFSGDKTADRKKVTEFIWFLKAWKASKLIGGYLSAVKNDPIISVSIGDMKGKMIGALKIFDRIEGGSIGFTADEEQFLHYAVSGNLRDICAVSSIDMKKIPDQEDVIQ